jgi:putative membrane protein
MILALAATLLRLARTLPWQNVIACAVLTGALAGIFQGVGARTGIPFGPFFYTENIGHLVFHEVPWPLPLLYIAILLNVRDVARLILWRWRETTNYGVWVISLASLLATVFDAGLEPIASTGHWWIWTTSKSIPSWQGAPWINFAGWIATSFFILALATPWLINKKTSSQSPRDYFSLIIWVILTLLLAVNNASHKFWMAAALTVAVDIVLVVLALRNSNVPSQVAKKSSH